MRIRTVSIALAALVASGVAVAVPSQAAALCADPKPETGEWRQYSHDLDNSRNQPLETVIDAERAASLEQKWAFDITQVGGAGDFNNDPIVADGCVYLGSTAGDVVALNADTGELVWRKNLADLHPDLDGTGVNSTPTVDNGKIYLHATRSEDPRLVVLDQETGALLWQVALLADISEEAKFGTELISSPKVFAGKVFSGISGAGAESGNTFGPTPIGQTSGFDIERTSRLRFRGIYAITDEVTKEVETSFTIPDSDFFNEETQQGYSGGGVWSSPAVDLEGGYAYVGAGNPFTPREHQNTNAILKIGIDPTRTDYMQIVDRYKGNNDSYVDGVEQKPVCEAYIDVFTCELGDYDFGASPQLFEKDGVSYVGGHQKSGVYHVATRGGMDGVWEQVVGVPFGMLGGEGTASYVDGAVVVPGGTPGLVAKFDAVTGAQQWVAPIADGVHFTSLTTANGVAYVVDSRGMLDIWDLETGRQIAAKSLNAEVGQPPGPAFSAGHSVTVARNTVFAPVGGYVIAYQ